MTDTLVIRDVTLIDGTGAPALENATIVVEGGRIASVGRGAAGTSAGVAPGGPGFVPATTG